MRYRVEVLGDSPLSGTILDLQIELPTVEDDFKKQSSSFDELERHLQVATSASLPIAQEAFNQLKESGQEFFFGASLTWKLVTWTYELAMSRDGSISVGGGFDLYYRHGWAAARDLCEEQEPIGFLGDPETLLREEDRVSKAILALRSVYICGGTKPLHSRSDRDAQRSKFVKRPPALSLITTQLRGEQDDSC